MIDEYRCEGRHMKCIHVAYEFFPGLIYVLLKTQWKLWGKDAWRASAHGERNISALCCYKNIGGDRHGVVGIQTLCTVCGSNSDGGDVLLTYPDRPRFRPRILCSEYRLSCLGIKWPGRGFDHPPLLALELNTGWIVLLLWFSDCLSYNRKAVLYVSIQVLTVLISHVLAHINIFVFCKLVSQNNSLKYHALWFRRMK
jgi:hypothetical protein